MKKGKCRVCTEALYFLFLTSINTNDVKMDLLRVKKGIEFELETGRLFVRFENPSGFFRTFFGNPSGTPEGFRKDSRRIPEENNKKTGNRYKEVQNI